MPIYRTEHCQTVSSNGVPLAPAYLPDGRIALLPVVFVREFDPSIPGAWVSLHDHALGRVIDVQADQTLLVQWLAGAAGESLVHPRDVSFVEYASLASPLDAMTCPTCKAAHHPNVRCAARERRSM